MAVETLTQFMPGAGMNSAFLAELFSGVLAHERCGRHLYKTCEARTNSSALRTRYRDFGSGDRTARRDPRAADLRRRRLSPTTWGRPREMVLGSDTSLVEATFKLGGSLDLVTAEFAMLDAVFLAESMDHANWTSLAGPRSAARRHTLGRAAPQRRRRGPGTGSGAPHLESADEGAARHIASGEGDGTALLSDTAEDLLAAIEAWPATFDLDGPPASSSRRVPCRGSGSDQKCPAVVWSGQARGDAPAARDRRKKGDARCQLHSRVFRCSPGSLLRWGARTGRPRSSKRRGRRAIACEPPMPTLVRPCGRGLGLTESDRCS